MIVFQGRASEMSRETAVNVGKKDVWKQTTDSEKLLQLMTVEWGCLVSTGIKTWQLKPLCFFKRIFSSMHGCTGAGSLSVSSTS